MLSPTWSRDVAHASSLPTPTPLPVVTQPGRWSFQEWCARYDYYISCIFNNLRHAITSDSFGGDDDAAERAFDWAGMYQRLRRYLYRVSANQSRRYSPAV